MVVLYKPIIHCLGSSIGTPVALTPLLSMYTCGSNFDNLSLSFTSWSAYHSLSTHPRKYGKTCTPVGMRRNTRVTSIFLHGDLWSVFFLSPLLAPLRILPLGTFSLPLPLPLLDSYFAL
jgi:hypothetical protein